MPPWDEDQPRYAPATEVWRGGPSTIKYDPEGQLVRVHQPGQDAATFLLSDYEKVEHLEDAIAQHLLDGATAFIYDATDLFHEHDRWPFKQPGGGG